MSCPWITLDCDMSSKDLKQNQIRMEDFNFMSGPWIHVGCGVRFPPSRELYIVVAISINFNQVLLQIRIKNKVS